MVRSRGEICAFATIGRILIVQTLVLSLFLLSMSPRACTPPRSARPVPPPCHKTGYAGVCAEVLARERQREAKRAIGQPDFHRHRYAVAFLRKT